MIWNGPSKQAMLLAVAAAGAYLCLLIGAPFLAPLTWALALAIVLHPLQRLAERHIGHRGAASLVVALGGALAFGIVAIFAAYQLLREMGSGAARVAELMRDWDAGAVAQRFPRLGSLAEWLAVQLDPARALERLGEWLTQQGGSVVRVSINQALGLAITFYMLFYFLRDRERILAAIVDLTPMAAEDARAVLARIGDTVHATIRGTILVAAVQGALGGFMFHLLGLPAPAFWGVIMALLAIVPVLGAFVVWIPAAAVLALEGEWLKATVLAVWGGVFIAGIDNLLYPVLVGSQLRLHTLLVFVGAVGGIVVFGAHGVVLGPVIIVATLSVIEIAARTGRRTRDGDHRADRSAT